MNCQLRSFLDMTVYLGQDHRGFNLAKELVLWLTKQGVTVHNVGASTLDPLDDYVDFAAAVGREVGQTADSGVRGIVICGSGVGVCVAANKIPGVRCGIGLNPAQVASATEHDHMNVLSLAADYLDLDAVKPLVTAFLKTEYTTEERHLRRINKVSALEV